MLKFKGTKLANIVGLVICSFKSTVLRPYFKDTHGWVLVRCAIQASMEALNFSERNVMLSACFNA